MAHLRSATLVMAAVLAAAPLMAEASQYLRNVTIWNQTQSPVTVKAFTYATHPEASAMIFPKGKTGDQVKEPATGWTIAPGQKVEFTFRSQYYNKKEEGVWGFRVFDSVGNPFSFAQIATAGGSDCDWFAFNNAKDSYDYNGKCIEWQKDSAHKGIPMHTFLVQKANFRNTVK
jgi:hypothetical protein